MKKLSEILELAMPDYIENIKRLEKEERVPPAGNMCIRISDLELKGKVSIAEFFKAKRAIDEKIEGRTFLSDYLEAEDRKTSALAQIRFYKQWIRELKESGL